MRMLTVTGLMSFRAPEVISGSVYTESIDIWGLGCVLYQLITNSAPFLKETSQDTLEAIVKEPVDLSKVNPTFSKLIPLVQACLAKEAKNRPSALEVMTDEVLLREEMPSGFSSVSFNPEESPHSWMGHFELNKDLLSAYERNSKEQFDQMEEFIKDLQHGEDLLLNKHRTLSMTAGVGTNPLLSPLHRTVIRRFSNANELIGGGIAKRFE